MTICCLKHPISRRGTATVCLSSMVHICDRLWENQNHACKENVFHACKFSWKKTRISCFFNRITWFFFHNRSTKRKTKSRSVRVTETVAQTQTWSTNRHAQHTPDTYYISSLHKTRNPWIHRFSSYIILVFFNKSFNLGKIKGESNKSGYSKTAVGWRRWREERI